MTAQEAPHFELDLSDPRQVREELIRLAQQLGRWPGRHKVMEHFGVREAQARRILDQVKQPQDSDSAGQAAGLHVVPTQRRERRQSVTSLVTVPNPNVAVVDDPTTSDQQHGEPRHTPPPDIRTTADNKTQHKTESDGHVAVVDDPTTSDQQHGEPTTTKPTRKHTADGQVAKDDTSRGALFFYLVFANTLLVSLDTNWRLFEYLGVSALWERAVMFVVLDFALIACGVAMRASIRSTGQPGPARMLAWALSGVAAFGAIVMSGPIVGTLRVLLGPVLGIVALHMALGIEMRSHNGGSTTMARIGFELRERMLSWLGLGNDQRDALARIRDRAAYRAARLAMAPKYTPFRKRRLERALRKSYVAHDPDRRAALLNELATVRHADQLAKLPQPSPWVVH